MRRVCLTRSFVASLAGLRHYDAHSVNWITRRQSTLPPASTNNDDVEFGFRRPQFDNTSLIYSSKSNVELIRAYVVFSACSLDILVNNQAKVFFYWFFVSIAGMREIA